MKSVRNKRKELIQALSSKDKEKLRKALALTKPEKWLSVSIDKNKNIKLFNKSVTKQELERILDEEETNFQLKITLMVHAKFIDGCRQETWYFGGRELTFDLDTCAALAEKI